MITVNLMQPSRKKYVNSSALSGFSTVWQKNESAKQTPSIRRWTQATTLHRSALQCTAPTCGHWIKHFKHSTTRSSSRKTTRDRFTSTNIWCKSMAIREI